MKLPSFIAQAESTGFEYTLPADSRHTRVRPTPYGWAFLFLLFWVPLTALATANNFLLLVFIMLFTMTGVSHVLGKRNVASVQIRRRFPDEIFVGKPFTLKYLVKSSRKTWGALSIRLVEREPLSGMKSYVNIPNASPDKTVEFVGFFSAKSRGDHKIGPAVIKSAFPFGLAVYHRNCGDSADILVFPEIKPVDADIPSWLGQWGDGRERVAPSGSVPYSFRDYVPGDPYKAINWKKSASSNSLITKVQADEEAKNIAIRLPSDASEEALSKAASLLVYFSDRHIPVSLYGPGLAMGPGTGKDFLHRLLTVLARWGGHNHETIFEPEENHITFNVTPEGDLERPENATLT